MNTPHRASRLEGRITRGTTGTNRLRRIDRWILAFGAPALMQCGDVVDVGFGATAGTTIELAERLWSRYPQVRVTGLDIDPDRVASAQSLVNSYGDARIRVHHGGFELGHIFDSRSVAVVRAANVLRQYDEAEVPAAWSLLQRCLKPEGMLIDATCDEIGRVATWITLDEQEPRSLTISLRLAGLDTPLVAAERLPKVLIHRNIPGEPVHSFMNALQGHWDALAALSSFGARQRFIATCEAMRGEGWAVLHNAKRWRLGEVTVAWDQVQPLT